MTKPFQSHLVGTLTAIALLSGIHNVAQASFLVPATQNFTSLHAPIINIAAKKKVVHKRKVVRRSNNNLAPAAMLGLFGAILGAGIASDRYDNYSNYSYGQPYYNYNQPYYTYQQPYYGGSPWGGNGPVGRAGHRPRAQRPAGRVPNGVPEHGGPGGPP